MQGVGVVCSPSLAKASATVTVVLVRAIVVGTKYTKWDPHLNTDAQVLRSTREALFGDSPFFCCVACMNRIVNIPHCCVPPKRVVVVDGVAGDMINNRHIFQVLEILRQWAK